MRRPKPTAPSSEAETPRTDSLVARLMGIDGLPDSQQPWSAAHHKKQPAGRHSFRKQQAAAAADKENHCGGGEEEARHPGVHEPGAAAEPQLQRRWRRCRGAVAAGHAARVHVGTGVVGWAQAVAAGAQGELPRQGRAVHVHSQLANVLLRRQEDELIPISLGGLR
jgi:hypothetical protein